MERMEWLKQRKSALGGTDVAAVLGLSKYKTAHHVFLDKTSDTVTDIPDNKFMKWGRMLEGVVATAFTEETNREVIEVDGFVRSAEHPFLGGTPDRFIVADPSLTDVEDWEKGEGVLEVKTVNQYSYQDWEQSVPPYYYVQLMHYLYVTGAQWGAFAILIGGSEFKIFKVQRDQAFIDKMVAICVKFWTENVMTNTPPAKEAADFELSKILMPSPILASTDILALAAELTDVRAQVKDLEAKEEELSTKIKTFMGDHETLVGDAQQKIATWKLIKGRTALDAKALKEAHPEIVEKFTKTGEQTRQFRFTGVEVAK